jgi:hypothetical protein
MSEKEILVTEEVAENVEQTTEETPKMFTQDEVNEIVGKSKARERAKITKQFERRYGQLENVLKAGTGKESVEEMTDTFADFYRKKGIDILAVPYAFALDPIGKLQGAHKHISYDVDILARGNALPFGIVYKLVKCRIDHFYLLK